MKLVKMKITAFSGVYEVFKTELSFMFCCGRCHKIVEPDELLLGKAHIYAMHCGVMQDVGLVNFKPGLKNR